MNKPAFIKRSTAEAVFRALLDDATQLLDTYDFDKSTVPTLRKVQQAIETALADCKEANNKYLEFLNKEEAEVEWVRIMQKRYNQVTDKMESRITSKECYDQNKKTKQSNLRLEKIKMPKFDGELKRVSSV